MTSKQAAALAVATDGIRARGRGSVTAAYVAGRLGWSVRQASGVLTSLDRAGHLRSIPDGFVQRTFYVLPDYEEARR